MLTIHMDVDESTRLVKDQMSSPVFLERKYNFMTKETSFVLVVLVLHPASGILHFA